MSFTSKISKILFVSAFSGFGFSFGRDIYKSAKKNLLLMIFLTILFLSFLGGYTSSVWFFRNQKNLLISFFYKLGSFILFNISLASYSFCLVLILFLFSILSQDINKSDNTPPKEQHQNKPNEYFIYHHIRDFIKSTPPLQKRWSWFNSQHKDVSEITKVYAAFIDNLFIEKKFYPFILIVILGCLAGIKQRLQRSRAWKAERNNVSFLIKNNLKDTNDHILVDQECQEFKLKEVCTDFIEFMPVGKRGKRAYIKLNSKGEFIDWSGIIQEDQRGTFLHAK